MKKILPGALLILILLSSCSMGVKYHYSFQDDGSGAAQVSYYWPRLLSVVLEGLAEAPFSPVDEEQAFSEAQMTHGVDLLTVERTNRFFKSYQYYEYQFDSLEDFSQVEGFGDTSGTLTATEEGWHYQNLVHVGWKKKLDDPEQFLLGESMQGLLEKVKFHYRIEAPGRIRSEADGRLSLSRRTAQYQFSLGDFRNSTEDAVLDLYWD